MTKLIIFFGCDFGKLFKMDNYDKDREFSDRTFKNNEELFKRRLGEILGNRVITFNLASDRLDRDNSIDAIAIMDLVEELRVQYRFQNSKKNDKTYEPTLRLTRPNSRSDTQQNSEFFKIDENIKTGQPYPDVLMWGLVEDGAIKRLEFVNVSKFYELFNNHRIQFKGDFEEYKGDGDILYMRQFKNSEFNYSGNSTFVVLPSKEECPEIYEF